MVILLEKRILKLLGIIEGDYCQQPAFTADQETEDLFIMYYEQMKPLMD